KEEAQRRRRLRADLESRLNEALAGVRDWETERRRLASELESAADILVSRSRGAAAQCAVLRHRADRLRLRLGEVRAGLAPLIGEPAFLEDNLLTGAVQLAEAGRNLDTLRDRLRASHDRVTVDLEAVLSKPDPAVFASLETDLVRLRSASDGYTSLVGLKKQIETLARVRNQAIRIRGLEAGRRRDRAELLRLGTREKRLGLSLNQTRNRLERLRAERSRLTEELASARSRATGLARHFNDDIYPLIRVLALALERGKARNEALEADNRTLSGEIVQLAEKSRRTEEAAGLLSRSVTRLRQVLNRRESEMGILRGRSKAMSDRLEAQESLAGDFEALARHRGRQVQTLQDQLADLYPLLEFFIDQVRLWTGPPRREQETVTALPEGSDLLVLMVHMLGYENENLRTKLGVIEDERRLWVFENEHLSRSHDLMKSRLETLQPLLAFFWQAWFTNTSALADAHHQLGRLTRQSSDLQAEKAGLENRIARLRAGLGETRQSLALTEAALEKSESGLLASQLDRTELRESLARMTDRAEALERSGARAARESEARGARLKSLLKDHASLRSRFSQTDADRESFRSLAVARGAEIRTLRTQLEARTGQVEAAWVGASHIAARSAEALSGLQAELEDRTRLLEERETELARFRRRVDELEAGQDRLGLLLWTIARYGGDNQAVWEALVELNRDKGFKDAAVIAAARLAELTAAGAAKIRSDQFRRAARQTVRRGLYSLLLAGGMVFALPEEPSIATALLEDPAGRERMVENLGGQLRMEPVPAPDTVYSPLVGRPFDASFARPWDRARGTERIEALVRDEISALARQVGLEPREYIGYLRRQFKPGQTVRLPKLMDLRNAFEHLDGEFPYISYDFRGAYPELTQVQTLYALARSADSAECHFWDRLYGDYRLLGADPSICLNMILANANRYAAWRDHRPDVAFVGRLKPIPELEKAGPARFLRIMVPYIKAHVRAITSNEIYAYAHKPDQIDEYARRFAEDLYVASKAFGVPLTLMVAISHQESYFANVLGDRSRSASPFQIWEPTKPFILSQMDKQGIQVPGVPKRLQDHLTLATYMAAFYLGQLIEQHTVAAPKDGPPRCNLARVALSYNGGQAYPGAVERKQQRLSAYLDRLAPKAPDEPKPKNGA
ncbi:MAG: hypothetical protein KKB20_26440, partial [Proteobacteria bacterium]|nr:hypothetical protein [Pseudomonadota bacterium]